MSQEDAREVLLDIREAVKRLDAIINILFETSSLSEGRSSIPIGRRIEILYDAGLRPIEISRILGKSVSNVSVQLNLLRKKKMKREKHPPQAQSETTTGQAQPSSPQ